MKVVCFHNPDEENGFLSNWYMSDFSVDGIQFSSMEQYMMYSKATLFGDYRMADKILQESDPRKIKAYGRKVHGFNEQVWEVGCSDIVFKGLLAKFQSNKDLKDKLMATGDSELAECAVNDTIWGIGISMKDPKRFDKSQWNGKNLLGNLLMQVRKTLECGVCLVGIEK